MKKNGILRIGKKILINALLMSVPTILLANSIDFPPVVSYNILETNKFNKKIRKAAQNKEEWVHSPLLIACKYGQAGEMASLVSIMATSDGGEGSLTATVTIVEDGYLDDSIRGGWFKFYLDRNNTEFIWRVKEIRQANLCGRMNSPYVFSKKICP